MRIAGVGDCTEQIDGALRGADFPVPLILESTRCQRPAQRTEVEGMRGRG